MKTYMSSRERTIGFIVQDKASSQGERTFLYFKDKEYTYKELNERSNQFANFLSELGVKKGDKVVTMLPNIPEYFYVWWGIVKLGAWEVPINLNYRGGSLIDLIDRCDAEIAVIYHKIFQMKFVAIQQKVPKIKKVVVAHRLFDEEMDVDTSAARIAIFKFSDFVYSSTEAPEKEVFNYDPSCIVYTSGTTGPPKAVVNSHEFWVHSCESKIRHMGTSSNDVIYNCFPMYNPTGQVETSLTALLAEAQVAMAETFQPQRFWQDIKRYKCTETVSMGGAFALVEKNPPSPEDKNHPLKKIYIIPLPEKFQKQCEERFGLRMMEIYGQTECGLVCFRTWDKGKMGSCGFANCGYEIKIFDENDIECPPNTEGEIVIRPNKSHIIAREYYKMPEKFGAKLKNCWWHTGDLGRMDEDGYLFFHRRKEETVRFRGFFVSTTEVELTLNRHDEVLESAVFGVPDELGQEQDVMAVVRLRSKGSVSPEELLRHCEADLPFHMIPCYVRFVDDFEKTPTMRIIKEKLWTEGITTDTWNRRKANYKLSRE